MYKSGIPIQESLMEMARGGGSISLRAAIARVVTALRRGTSMNAALYNERLVDSLQARLVEAGEKTGTLESIFPAIATDAQRRIKLRRTVIMKLAYPVFSIVAAILLIPLSTLVSSGFGTYFKEAILPLLGLTAIGAIIVYFVRFMGKRGQNRLYRDKLLLGIPLLGRLMRNFAWARFCRAFALSYGAGMDLRETVRLAVGVMGNQALQEEMAGALSAVDRGSPLSNFFTASLTTPQIITDLLGTGEQTGRFDEMMNSAANHFEELSERQLMAFTTALYVLAFLLSSVYIGYKVITFYTGLFKMEMSF
ncbi:MAG: type II secretion system F family protein [Nitrospirae bacterium]|nr:type II secretion system F family protein [Nitrospirota bacterium]